MFPARYKKTVPVVLQRQRCRNRSGTGKRLVFVLWRAHPEEEKCPLGVPALSGAYPILVLTIRHRRLRSRWACPAVLVPGCELGQRPRAADGSKGAARWCAWPPGPQRALRPASSSSIHSWTRAGACSDPPQPFNNVAATQTIPLHTVTPRTK